MKEYPDFSGSVFKNLTISNRAHSVGRIPRYNCVCVCGRFLIVLHSHLERGSKTDCGCVTKTEAVKSRTKRGLGENLVYRAWREMLMRAKAAGIEVCPRWEVFKNFELDVDYPSSPQMIIQRVDNDRPFGPTNKVWSRKSLLAIKAEKG